MNIIDYNQPDIFSVETIQREYIQLCKQYGIKEPLPLEPEIWEEGDRRWIYSIWDEVIKGIESDDLACIDLSLKCLEYMKPIPFGRITRSRIARSLKRANLNMAQKSRIRKLCKIKLDSGRLGTEFKDYSRLLVKVGFADMVLDFTDIDKDDPDYVVKYKKYFQLKYEETNCVE